MAGLSFILRTVLLTAAACGFTACAGYQLGTSRPAIMRGVSNIAVPVFHNETQMPRTSVLITNRSIQQFQIDGTYRITGTDRADAIVRGTIRPLRRTQLRADRFNTLRTLEQEVRLQLDYTVEARSGTILTSGSVEGSSSFRPEANWQRSESQAIDEAAARLASQLVSRLAEGW